jgi:hypothetical protein
MPFEAPTSTAMREGPLESMPEALASSTGIRHPQGLLAAGAWAARRGCGLSSQRDGIGEGKTEGLLSEVSYTRGLVSALRVQHSFRCGAGRSKFSSQRRIDRERRWQ